MTESPTVRLAVLIDADNVSSSHSSALLAELARYGIPTVKRAYGDWTTQQLAGWKSRAGAARDPADPAVRQHGRQELDRLRADHRRDGPALLRQPRRVRPGVQRQRLHPARHPAARVRQDRLRPRPAQDAGIPAGRVRQVHLPGGPARPGRRRRRRAGAGRGGRGRLAARPAHDPGGRRTQHRRRRTAGRRWARSAPTWARRTRRSTRATTASPASACSSASRTTSTSTTPRAGSRGSGSRPSVRPRKRTAAKKAAAKKPDSAGPAATGTSPGRRSSASPGRRPGGVQASSPARPA